MRLNEKLMRLWKRKCKEKLFIPQQDVELFRQKLST